eukprot:CAMPEP_0196813920 /NCGR_PEP_ID=MMETSP1362-20130617/40151_1 /TAXON_ID=163516 /ORGANISM="Leptocylindrus danicus, Strain CCMP1856" /LENGTH=459 /DNA_ID=CAMNT_0042190357 /DNA_START=33 /DNA_END=1412 /DNA_ORIENTATION=-
MAPKIPSQQSKTGPGQVGPSWGVDANTTGGGVWANTSAKRDKLAELKRELTDEQETLDDAATSDQVLDLNLADGIRLVARAADERWTSQSLDEEAKRIEFSVVPMQATSDTAYLNKVAFESHLDDVVVMLRRYTSLAPPSTLPHALAQLRDFEEWKDEFDDSTENNVDDAKHMTINSDDDYGQSTSPGQAFDECTVFYRSLLASSAAEHLKANWDGLTEVTSADIDRAAIEDKDPPIVNELSLAKINAVLDSFCNGQCRDRVEALWKLVDHDEDGLIDQENMEKVVYMSIAPVEEALKKFVAAAVESSSMLVESTGNTGMMQRRRESRAKKRFNKLFAKAIMHHFDVEVETPHRLRCAYAWAEKAHQDGKLESVLIEAGTIAGRKRYVELSPKISFAEFSMMTEEIFQQVDRVGEEIVSSFREDLLVDQGKGRQNKELLRECMIGLGIVCLFDAGITTL